MGNSQQAASPAVAAVEQQLQQRVQQLQQAYQTQVQQVGITQAQVQQLQQTFQTQVQQLQQAFQTQLQQQQANAQQAAISAAHQAAATQQSAAQQASVAATQQSAAAQHALSAAALGASAGAGQNNNKFSGTGNIYAPANTQPTVWGTGNISNYTNQPPTLWGTGAIYDNSAVVPGLIASPLGGSASTGLNNGPNNGMNVAARPKAVSMGNGMTNVPYSTNAVYNPNAPYTNVALGAGATGINGVKVKTPNNVAVADPPARKSRGPSAPGGFKVVAVDLVDGESVNGLMDGDAYVGKRRKTGRGYGGRKHGHKHRH